MIVVPAVTAALVVLISLAGTLFVSPGVSPWPRFWGVVFFSLLLWPVALTLLGRIAGRRAQVGVGLVITLLTSAQQLGAGALPLPLVVRWSVSLVAPGDSIRRELTLPPAGDGAWERAWSEAARTAVAVCTEEQIPVTAGVSVSLNDGPLASLATLDRTGKPDSPGWYQIPVSRDQVEARRPFVVLVRREGDFGPVARFCGGQDDPTRPGWAGSARLRAGQWVTEQLADVPIPPIGGMPAPSRYYIELRFYDHAGLPHVGIWY